MSRRAQPYRKSLGTRPPGPALDNMLRGTALGDAFTKKGQIKSPDPQYVAMLTGKARLPRQPRAPRKPRA